MRREPTPPASAPAPTWLLSLTALTALGVLGVARWLTPSPAGFGTHQQLGLPACPLAAWLGLPCPACGLTTGFAQAVRADLLGAWQANPLAPLLCAATCWALLLSMWGLWRGESAPRLRLPSRDMLVAVALLGLLAWCARVWAAAY